MAEAIGLMRVVSPQQLAVSDAESAAAKNFTNSTATLDLAGHIRQLYTQARSHRDSSGETERLIEAMRAYRGEYSPMKQAEINAFAGSKVYARMTAVKCRAATAILKDIYSTNPESWSLAPTPQPTIPSGIMEGVLKLVESETGVLTQAGTEPPPEAIAARVRALQDAALAAEGVKASEEAKKATRYTNDILTEGKFYEAINQFLMDLPIFPFACIKGPIVRMALDIEWNVDGTRRVKQAPKLFWERVSPFDLYTSPGASDIKHSWTVETIRLTRAGLQDMEALPGFDKERIKEILENPTGGRSYMQWADGERAQLERRENPVINTNSDFLDAIEFHGYVRGQLLSDWGIEKEKIPELHRDYFASCWLVNGQVIKAQLSSAMFPKPPYYITSFEKAPGSIHGHGLPEILNDIQEVTNAALRALVNNLSISSGPQVVINSDRVDPATDSANLYPWKRWYITSDPLAVSGEKPIDFFQPASNAQELLSVYKEFTNVADEVSAIPRYLTGSQRTGGAAATASGLSMLMMNSGKVMQSVASNIDGDILRAAIGDLYEFIMVNNPGHLRGDEEIVVKGVSNAMKREQDRVRQLEFLGLTANPIDLEILGKTGRATILKAIAEGLGLDHEEVVPPAGGMEQTPPGGPGAAPQAAPNEGKSSAAPPRKDIVSNMSTT